MIMGVVRSEIADQPARAFVEIDRRSLIVVIADVTAEPDRGLRQVATDRISWRRPPLPGARMGVQHAGELRTRTMDRPVDHVAGFV